MINHAVNSGLVHELRIPIQTQPVLRLPIYRTIERTKKDHGVLTRNPGKKAFTLLFNGDTLPAESGALQVVHVESIDEASRFLQLLGNTCEIFLSPDYRMTHPGVYAFVKALLYPSQNALPPFDINTAAALMQKLPFDLKSLVKSPLAITLDDKYPCPINKKFVHKKNASNVLVSDFYSAGRLLYFNMLGETEELVFDHSSDHVQGMLMLEALRQAALATAHILGLPFTGGLALLNYNTNFFHYLERDAPIVLRAYGDFSANETSEDKEAPIFIQVIQWGKVCADATMKAFAYINGAHYEQQKVRLEKISARSKMQFDAKVSRILEAEPSI